MFGPVDARLFRDPRGARRHQHHARTRRSSARSSPYWAVDFFALNPKLAFLALGSVFLAVTGAEDALCRHGPFRPQGDRLPWLTLVYPCLMLNYMGQGALLLDHPAAVDNPFFLMAPEWARLPLVCIATAGDDHRQPGGDLGRLLGHPPGGPARLPAAPADRAHQREGRRADLHPGRQLGPAGDGRRCWCSASANPPSSPRPMASRSPARC